MTILNNDQDLVISTLKIVPREKPVDNSWNKSNAERKEKDELLAFNCQIQTCRSDKK